MAESAAGLLDGRHDGGAKVRDQCGGDVEVVAATGVGKRAVASPTLISSVPVGVVGERELHGREDVVFDPPLEDGGCEILCSDPGGEGGPEKLLEGTAGPEEAAEGGDW